MPDVYQLHVNINHPLAGRSEHYFLASGTPTAAQADGAAYINIRKRLLARGCSVVGASITTYGPPPNSIPVKLGYPIFNTVTCLANIEHLPGGSGNSPGEILPSGDKVDSTTINEPKSGIGCRFVANNGARGDRIYAFPPDGLFVSSQLTIVDPGILTRGGAIPGALDNPGNAFKALLQWVLNNTMHGYLAFNPRLIKSVTNTVVAIIETTTPIVIPGGAKVVITGVVGADGVNGTWTPTVIDSTHFRIDNAVAPGVYVNGGQVSAQRSSLVTEPWSSAFFVRPTGKNVGRPTGPFRGRQLRKRVS